VTRQFCDWVASLGGSSNNIDEATITSMFASGYETKPALSVPIHVVELANVPPELRLSTDVPLPPPSQPASARPRPKLSCARVRNVTYSHSLLHLIHISWIVSHTARRLIRFVVVVSS